MGPIVEGIAVARKMANERIQEVVDVNDLFARERVFQESVTAAGMTLEWFSASVNRLIAGAPQSADPQGEAAASFRCSE
jgi:hypothetical protein